MSHLACASALNQRVVILSRVLVTWGKVCRKSVKAALNPKRSHFTSLQALFHQMRSKFKILRNLALPRKAAYSF